MKKLIPFVIIAALVVVACERDSVLETPERQNLVIETIETTQGSDAIPGQTRASTEIAQAEKLFLWSSFFTAKVLRYDAPARSEFLAELNANNAASLSDLLNANLNPAFENAFRNYVTLYLQCEQCPGNETANPPQPIGPLGGGGAPLHTQTQIFIDMLIQDNCIEIFVPNTLNFSEPFEITSTAHPFTGGPWNNGHKRTFEIFKGSYTHHVGVVDLNYVNTNNVIVARPKVNPFDPDCAYDEFGVEDFTLFLNPNP